MDCLRCGSNMTVWMCFHLHLHTNTFSPSQSFSHFTLIFFSLFSRFFLLPILMYCIMFYFNWSIVAWFILQHFSLDFQILFPLPLFPVFLFFSLSLYLYLYPLLCHPPTPPSCSPPHREFSKEREKAKARGDFQKLREKQQLEEDLKVSCPICACVIEANSERTFLPLNFSVYYHRAFK